LALVIGTLIRDDLAADLKPRNDLYQAKNNSLDVRLSSLLLFYPLVEPEMHLLDENEELDEASTESKILPRNVMKFFASSYLPAGEHDNMIALLQCNPICIGIRDDARRDRRVNILGSSLLLEDLPPTLIVTAGKDILLPENLKLASRLKQSRVVLHHLHYPDYQHGWISFVGHEKEELLEEINLLIHGTNHRL